MRYFFQKIAKSLVMSAGTAPCYPPVKSSRSPAGSLINGSFHTASVKKPAVFKSVSFNKCLHIIPDTVQAVDGLFIQGVFFIIDISYRRIRLIAA